MEPTEFDVNEDAGGHIAPLSSDNIPDINQSHYCFSCESPLGGLYCASCGQKNDNYRRSIFSLGAEFIGSITAIESRIWRTWAALLFKPGKVAREFANGRRTYWSSPVRVYIAMSIILFGFLGLTNMQLISIDLDVKPKSGVTKPLEDMTADDLEIVPGLHFFETQRRIEERNKSRNFDLIAKKLDSGKGLSLNLADKDALDQAAREQDPAAQSTPPVGGTSAPETVIETDISTPETAESKKITINTINGKTVTMDNWSDLVFIFVKNPAKLNGAFFKYLPRIMFIMMPLTMLIAAIFIRGRGNALLYDHLVHAAYIHAVAFLLLLVGILISLAMPGSSAPQILFITMMVYLPLSLKRMFGRGWIKTIWTSYGVGFIYALIMVIIMFSLLILQLTNTVFEIGQG